MSFPITFTNAQDTITEIVAAHINALEVKVGIDSSADPNSLDYKANRAAPLLNPHFTGTIEVDGNATLHSRLLLGNTYNSVFILGGNDSETGGSNVAIGYMSGISLTTGSSNTALGTYALTSLTVGSNNIAIGPYAMCWTGGASSNNISIGQSTIGSTTGSFNVGIGNQVMSASTVTGSNNTAIGYTALQAVTSGYDNVAVGSIALNYNQSGLQNTALGTYAMAYNVSGSKNIAIGYYAGIYELGSNHLWIDTQYQASLVDAQVKSLVYGTFDALTANQLFRINGKLEVLESATFSGSLDSGNLTSLISPINKSGTDTLTAAQCKGQVVYMSAAGTLTLPPVIIGSTVLIYSTGANVISVDPDAADRLILDGVAGGDGKKVTSDGTVGALVQLHGDSTNGWTVIGRAKTWTMEA